MEQWNMNIVDKSNREITASRLINAPRKLIWKVWTDPEHIINWWGPNGFTNTIDSMDVKAGGQWKFIMHGPDGVNYRNLITYLEVIEPELIIYEHGPSPKFKVTVTFEDLGEKTKLTMQMLFATSEERDRTVEKFNAVEGLKQTLGKLQEYLKKYYPH